MDLGYRGGGQQVRSGLTVNGNVHEIERNRGVYNYVDIKVEYGGTEYIIRYQHITPNEKLEVGQTVTPETLLGEIIYWVEDWGDNSHLHLEVRREYENGVTEVYNPLNFFPQWMVNSFDWNGYDNSYPAGYDEYSFDWFQLTSWYNFWRDGYKSRYIGCPSDC